MKLTCAVIGFWFLTTAILAASQDQQYVISTYAGGAPPPTPASGLNMPMTPGHVAVDALGNAYFTSFNCVFRLDASGVVTRVAGSSRAGYSGDGGLATDAQFGFIYAVAVDRAGNLFILDSLDVRVRKVTPDGMITTVAGNGTRGFSGDGGPATMAQFCYPLSMAVDRAGNLFVGDSSCGPPGYGPAGFGNRIRRVSPDGIITTVAGNGKAGASGDGGLATGAELAYPTSIAADDEGNLFIAQQKWGIRKVSPDGIITTVLDTGTSSAECIALVSRLANAYCFVDTVAVDRAGRLVFTQYGGDDAFEWNDYQAILQLSREGVVTTVVGNRVWGYSGDGGPAINAQTSYVSSIGVDDAGELFLSDARRIRKISPDGIIRTVAGNGTDRYLGDGGSATSAQLDQPAGTAVDPAGNVFIVERNRIRKVSAAGTITTVQGGGACGDITGDNGPALAAQLNCESASRAGVVADSAGNLFIAEKFRIRKISPDGIITTVAGNGSLGYSGDGGLAIYAQMFNWSATVVVDGAGNLFFADNGTRIRKVSPDGIITTVAGNGTSGYSGDGGPAVNAQLRFAFGIAVDRTGNLFIADGILIRKVWGNGVITTMAGNRSEFSGNDSQANATNGTLGALAVDGMGNLLVAVHYGIRKVSSDGTISTVAGNGLPGYSGDGGLATKAQLNFDHISSMAVDGAGNIYVADILNSAVRILRPVNGQF